MKLKAIMQFIFSNIKFVCFLMWRGLGGFFSYKQFLQNFHDGKSVKKLPVDVHRQCLLFQNEQ